MPYTKQTLRNGPILPVKLVDLSAPRHLKLPDSIPNLPKSGPFLHVFRMHNPKQWSEQRGMMWMEYWWNSFWAADFKFKEHKHTTLQSFPTLATSKIRNTGVLRLHSIGQALQFLQLPTKLLPLMSAPPWYDAAVGASQPDPEISSHDWIVRFVTSESA